MKFRILFAGFVSISSLCLFFQIPNVPAQEKLTMEKSIAEALEKNWSLKATEEKIQQAISIRDQAKTEFLPKAGMSYGYTRLSEKPRWRTPSESVVTGTEDNYEWRGTVTQPLFTGFALLSTYQLARLGLDQSKAQLELESLDLAWRVKQAYFDILMADKAVLVAEKDLASRTSNVDVVRSFYKVKMIPVNDLLKAEVELTNAQQKLIKAQNDAESARAAFNRILSRPVAAEVNVEDILTYNPENFSFDDLQDQALYNRPEIKLIDINLLQADQNIRLARSRYFPEVSLNYSYIRTGDTASVSGSDYTDAGHWEAMTLCTWTFWEWGKTRYGVYEKESLKKELLKIRLSLEEDIGLEVKQALLDIETAQKNIPTTKKAVEQAEENLRVNEVRYNARVNTITEVLDAQSILTQARVDYYRALYGHHLARANLMRALGKY